MCVDTKVWQVLHGFVYAVELRDGHVNHQKSHQRLKERLGVGMVSSHHQCTGKASKPFEIYIGERHWYVVGHIGRNSHEPKMIHQEFMRVPRSETNFHHVDGACVWRSVILKEEWLEQLNWGRIESVLRRVGTKVTTALPAFAQDQLRPRGLRKHDRNTVRMDGCNLSFKKWNRQERRQTSMLLLGRASSTKYLIRKVGKHTSFFTFITGGQSTRYGSKLLPHIQLCCCFLRTIL